MTTKKEKESLPATEDFTFKICGIVKAVVPLEYVGANGTEKRWLVIAQKGGDQTSKYHPTIVVTYMGDKWAQIDNCGGIEEGDEVETTYTVTSYSWNRDGNTNRWSTNNGRSIKVINKGNSLFGGSAEDDLPF